MIEALDEYLGGNVAENVQKIRHQNKKISLQIDAVGEKIGSVNFDENVKNKQQKIKQFLLMNSRDIRMQLKALTSQSQELNALAQFVQTWITTKNDHSLDLQVFYGNLQSLQSVYEKSREHQIERRCLELMEYWLETIEEELNQKLTNLVTSNNEYIIINIGQIVKNRKIIGEGSSRKYVKNIFNKLITYDAHSACYILKIPNKISEKNNLMKVQKTVIFFSKQQANDHFQHLYQAISQTKILINKLEQILQHPESVKNSSRKCLEQIRGDIDYILPYLNLQNRKNILDLIMQNKLQDVSIFDLLVRLKLKGQDGQMLGKLVEGLGERVKENENNLDYIISYLQMAQNDQKTLNIGFYVSNSLIEELEDVIDYEWIKKLLLLREDFRFKIHNHDFV